MVEVDLQAEGLGELRDVYAHSLCHFDLSEGCLNHVANGKIFLAVHAFEKRIAVQDA